MKKNCKKKKTNQKKLIIEKLIKKKGNKLYVNQKGYDNSFKSQIDKKDLSQYFPKAYELFGGDINVKVDLSNYATKAELKSATGVDTSKSVAKSGLASLKTEIDKLDVGKLKTVPIDFIN